LAGWIVPRDCIGQGKLEIYREVGTAVTGKQIDRLLSILDRAVKIAERWADREYPIADENTEFTISRVGDQPKPRTLEEYNAFESEEVALARISKRLHHQA
jgi:hypothetical protein